MRSVASQLALSADPIHRYIAGEQLGSASAERPSHLARAASNLGADLVQHPRRRCAAAGPGSRTTGARHHQGKVTRALIPCAPSMPFLLTVRLSADETHRRRNCSPTGRRRNRHQRWWRNPPWGNVTRSDSHWIFSARADPYGWCRRPTTVASAHRRIGLEELTELTHVVHSLQHAMYCWPSHAPLRLGADRCRCNARVCHRPATHMVDFNKLCSLVSVRRRDCGRRSR